MSRKPAPQILLGLAAALGLYACGGDGSEDLQVQLEKIGNPAWKPVDFHQFSGRIGTPETGYAEFYALSDALLPAPKHIPHPALGTGPGAPHAGPYDTELEQGVQALGLEETSSFRLSGYTNGLAEVLTWMLVAGEGSPSGSSPDFASGKILPNTIFPILFVSDTLRAGVSCGAYEFEVPALDGNLDPSFRVDGHSHIPLFYAINGDPPLAPGCTDPLGAYEWRIRMTDTTGSGWDLTVQYEVQR